MTLSSVELKKIVVPHGNIEPQPISPVKSNAWYQDSIGPSEAKLLVDFTECLKTAKEHEGVQHKLHLKEVGFAHDINNQLKKEADEVSQKKAKSGKIKSVSQVLQMVMGGGLIIVGAFAMVFGIVTGGLSMALGALAIAAGVLTSTAAVTGQIANLDVKKKEGQSIAIKEQRSQSQQRISTLLDGAQKNHQNALTHTATFSNTIKNNHL